MSHAFIVKVYFYSLPSSLKNPQLAASPCVGLSRWFQRNVLQNTLSSACLLHFPQEFFFKISGKIKSPGLCMKARFYLFHDLSHSDIIILCPSMISNLCYFTFGLHLCHKEQQSWVPLLACARHFSCVLHIVINLNWLHSLVISTQCWWCS